MKIKALEEQKAVLYGAETIPKEIDPQTNRVIGIHVDSPYAVDKVISWITKATQVRQVKTIPELAYPHVYVGDKMTGNNEIVLGNQDVVTFSNDHLEAIDIKTQKTVEMLFSCIRNCVQITDLTDENLTPMALPIEINGRESGTFDMFFATYQETGQFICISFSPEDSESFYKYVMALQ